MEEEKLQIPYGLTIEQEYMQGFGSKELRQFLIGLVASAALGAVLLMFTGQMAALIISLMIGGAASMIAVRKDPYTRLSMVGQLTDMIRFRRTQKHYKYVYKSSWDMK